MKHLKNLFLAFLLCMIAIPSMALTSGDKGDKHEKHERYTKKKPITITAVYDFSTYPCIWGTFMTSGAFCVNGKAELTAKEYYHGKFAINVVTLCTDKGTITIREKVDLHTYCGYWKVVCGTGCYEDLKGYGTLNRSQCTEVLCGVVYNKIDRDDRDHHDKDNHDSDDHYKDLD
jgi:hypothetical protein